MRQSEYEQRRRALETQFQADVELLRAGYQAKLRALDMIWLASMDEALPAAPPPLPVRREPLQLPEAAPEPETPPEAPAAPEPALRRGQVQEDLDTIFADLPEEFEKRDVIRLLGYEPPRSTLNRVLFDLLMAHRTKIVRHSAGYNGTRYRKLPESASSG